MPLDGEYEPSPEKWVRDQVERYEATGGREANTLPGRSEPVIVFSTRGAKSGKVRKNPLMRVEHDGAYAMVASKGGAPEHPTWYHNLKAHPDQVSVLEGDQVWDGVAREVTGEERDRLFRAQAERSPQFTQYQQKTERLIPVVVLTPV